VGIGIRDALSGVTPEDVRPQLPMSVIGVAPNVRDNRGPDAAFTHKAACSEGFRDSGGGNRGYDPIAQAGGGVVESYPRGTEGKKTSASFLYNATRSLYGQAGLTYIRSKGSHHSVMRKTVPSTRATRTRRRAKR